MDQGAGMRATAFGLDVESELPLSLLDGSVAKPTTRTLGVSLQRGARLWWPGSAELLCDDRQPDGSLVYEIQAHPEAGYLIAGPSYGTHLLSGDGRLLLCDPEDLPDASWQRLLIAQVLPFAALLQGLEVFHASAVVWCGRAVGFLGRSGAGKTSLALELCRRGADFLADDVLALECGEHGLLAHPGTPIAGVARDEAVNPCGSAQNGRGAVIAVNEREHMLRVAGAPGPAPLAALFFLDRRADGPSCPQFEPSADAQLLLRATFNFVLATPARLRGLLEVCALAARLRVERVLCGPETSVSQLGAAVALRLGACR
jgi:hypothetical protein